MARNVDSMDSIEVGSDIDFEKRWRHLQITIWSLLILFVVAGLLGVFGRGPLSKTRVANATVGAEYERFARFKTPASLTLVIPESSRLPEVFSVTVDTHLLEGIRAEQTTPTPIATHTSARGASFEFRRMGAASVTHEIGQRRQ
jgi:hypothetical protein